MSIIIQNIGGPPDGVCKYQLRINKRIIAEFEHDRRDGLAECLRKASVAAGIVEDEEIAHLDEIRSKQRTITGTLLKKGWR